MMDQVVSDAEQRMLKAIDALKKEYSVLRVGRATPALLDKVMVDYYGTPTAVNQVANIGVPEPRMLIIQPWDKSMIPAIEKSILKSDLGITPANDGVVIRLVIPQLTEERRKDLVKVVKKKAEDSRVAIRNIRRETNDKLKAMEKKSEISEDESKRGQDTVQKHTDNYIKNIDKIMEAKEKEIMEV